MFFGVHDFLEPSAEEGNEYEEEEQLNLDLKLKIRRHKRHNNFLD